MSVLGTGGLGAVNLAGSLAGAQRNAGAAGQISQQAAERNAEIGRNAAAVRTLEDVGETNSTPDRDADGRLAYGHAEDELDPEQDETGSTASAVSSRREHRGEDAFGDRGRSLDLDA